MARKLDRISTEPGREAPQSFDEMLNEYYTLESQLKNLTEQARSSESALIEHAVTFETLGEFAKSGSDSEILVPLGRDSFARARLIDPGNVLVSVGGDVVLKKPVEEASKLAESKIKSYEQSLQALNTMISSIQQRMSQLGPQLEELSTKAQKH